MNYAKWGGGLYLERCMGAEIYENLFLLNCARRDGGAISLSGCERITLRGNRFVLNAAGRSSGKIDILNCTEIRQETMP